MTALHRQRGLHVGVVLAAMISAVIGGTMSLAPLVWADSTSFITSALATLDTGTLQLHAGRGAGYVVFLAGLFASGWTLSTAVLVQQVLYCASMGLLALTMARLVSPAYALVIAALAFYPGLQQFNNLVLAESFYASALAAALCLQMLAASSKRPTSVACMLFAAMVLTAIAALLKAQGMPVFCVVAPICTAIAWHKRSWLAGAAVVVALVVCTFMLGSAFSAKSRSQDPTSALFATKTLFCIHLDLVLASDTTEPFVAKAMGAHAPQFIDMLQKDFQSKEAEFKTLGFYADKCQYDGEMDQLGIAAAGLGIDGLSKWYLDAFVKAVIRHPGAYLRKVFRQMIYGLKMSLPPLGFGTTYQSVPSVSATVGKLMNDAGLKDGTDDFNTRITAPVLARAENPVHWLLRAASLIASLGLIAALIAPLWGRWRASPLAAPAAIAALVWFAQIGGVAMTHTLDIWRYISPVAPAAVMALALSARIAIGLARQRY